MVTQSIRFSRRYRAALLDYLLGSGEAGLMRGYDLGRGALVDGFGPLYVLKAHQKALHGILESTRTVSESLRRLQEADEFLAETLAPFEMLARSYMALVTKDHSKTPGYVIHGSEAGDER